MGNVFRIAVVVALLITVSPATNEPFAVATVPVQNSTLSPIWHALRLDLLSDELTITACRADPTCGSPAALKLIAIVDEAMQYDGRARIGHINRAINQAIPPELHKEVPWMSPLEALTLPGDCKSYAITKYAALGNAGIAAADRRLVIVRDRTHPRETHMVVVVRVTGDWLILDSETLTLVDSTAKPTYEPLHMLDDSGVRAFAPVANRAAS
jgi:predicted transglutaminase-like cysteine proteinase